MIKRVQKAVAWRVRRLWRRLTAPPARSAREVALSYPSLSQAGQDEWVFREVFNGRRDGYFVDIGAHNGIYLSNTFLLEAKFGWTGICIEANPDTFRLLEKNRACRCCNLCVDQGSGEVIFRKDGVLGGIVAIDTDNRNGESGDCVRLATRSLHDILEDAGAPDVIDYLTIDIEGAEDRALLGFPFERRRFLAMTVERPSAALREVLRGAGYLLVKEVPGLDAFFVHESFADAYHRNCVLHYEGRYAPDLAILSS